MNSLLSSLIYKSISLMKETKDYVNNPFSDSDIAKIVNNLKPLGVTHLDICTPMDYPAYGLKWANAIHSAGLKVLHRPTWNGLEGIYNVPLAAGVNRPLDTINFWQQKTVNYIIANPTLFADGDLWAPIPEATGNGVVGGDSTSWLPTTNPGVQANYSLFFNGLIDLSKNQFSAINKKVLTGFTTNNFSEVSSGWINQDLFDKAGMTVVDHYAQTPTEMDADIKKIYAQRGKQVFLEEWGNYWNNGSITDAQAMFEELGLLAQSNILIGFNYWGAWPFSNNEGILNSDLTVNDKGKLLGQYFSPSQTITIDPVGSTTTTQTYTWNDISVGGKKIGKVMIYH